MPCGFEHRVMAAACVGGAAAAGWSEKEDGLFLQPPAAVLETLVAVRMHLDECGIQNDRCAWSWLTQAPSLERTEGTASTTRPR